MFCTLLLSSDYEYVLVEDLWLKMLRFIGSVNARIGVDTCVQILLKHRTTPSLFTNPKCIDGFTYALKVAQEAQPPSLVGTCTTLLISESFSRHLLTSSPETFLILQDYVFQHSSPAEAKQLCRLLVKDPYSAKGIATISPMAFDKLVNYFIIYEYSRESREKTDQTMIFFCSILVVNKFSFCEYDVPTFVAKMSLLCLPTRKL